MPLTKLLTLTHICRCETLDVIISVKICDSEGMKEFITSRLFKDYYPNFTGTLAEVTNTRPPET